MTLLSSAQLTNFKALILNMDDFVSVIDTQ